MDSIIYLAFAVIYAGLLVWGLRLWASDSKKGMRYLLLLVTAALVWDNSVIGLGRWIGAGDLLEGMSLLRFWLHALMTPLLTLVSFDLIRRSGTEWARHAAVRWAAYIFTAALILYELVTETLPLEIKPLMEYGALRYVPVESSGPPLMVMLILIPLLTAGIVLWRRRVTKLLFWGTVLMILGSAIPLPVESSAVTNLFELLLIGSLWLSIYKLQR